MHTPVHGHGGLLGIWESLDHICKGREHCSWGWKHCLHLNITARGSRGSLPAIFKGFLCGHTLEGVQEFPCIRNSLETGHSMQKSREIISIIYIILLFFEALSWIHFAAMLKDRLTVRSQMRMTFPPRTDERNFRIYFSFLSRQCGPCGPVLSHQSPAAHGIQKLWNQELLLSPEHSCPSFRCSLWVSFRGICHTAAQKLRQVNTQSLCLKTTPNTAKAQPASAKRQLMYQAISIGCWPNIPNLGFSKLWLSRTQEMP